MKLPVYYGEPDHVTSGMRPNPAPVYGILSDHKGEPLDLDQDVLVTRMRRYGGKALHPMRARIVGIGHEGNPNVDVIQIRPHGSAFVETAHPADCEITTFDELRWADAEEVASLAMTRQDIDLERCRFGGVFFDHYQRAVIAAYLGRTIEK